MPCYSVISSNTNGSTVLHNPQLPVYNHLVFTADPAVDTAVEPEVVPAVLAKIPVVDPAGDPAVDAAGIGGGSS